MVAPQVLHLKREIYIFFAARLTQSRKDPSSVVNHVTTATREWEIKSQPHSLSYNPSVTQSLTASTEEMLSH